MTNKNIILSMNGNSAEKDPETSAQAALKVQEDRHAYLLREMRAQEAAANEITATEAEHAIDQQS